MNKKLIAVIAATAMAGSIGFASVASADMTVYGRVIAGADYTDSNEPGERKNWNFGASGFDGAGAQQSRIGVKGSYDLGNGFSSGYKVEKGWNASALSGRHQYVYLSGAAGTLTFGQQDNPFINAANWDQSWYLGGNAIGSSFRNEGIKYSTSVGAFSFDLMATGNAGDDEEDVDLFIGAASYDFGPLKVNLGFQNNSANGTPGTLAHDGFITTPAIAAVAAGPLTGHWQVVSDGPDICGVPGTGAVPNSNDEGVAEGTCFLAGTDRAAVDAVDEVVTEAAAAVLGDDVYDLAAISVNGSAGALDWYLGYQQSSADITGDDIDSFGVFFSYGINDTNKVYIEHEDQSHDIRKGEDFTATVFGYSHSFGDSTTFIGEYRTINNQGDVDPSRLALTVKVDF